MTSKNNLKQKHSSTERNPNQCTNCYFHIMFTEKVTASHIQAQLSCASKFDGKNQEISSKAYIFFTFSAYHKCVLRTLQSLKFLPLSSYRQDLFPRTLLLNIFTMLSLWRIHTTLSNPHKFTFPHSKPFTNTTNLHQTPQLELLPKCRSWWLS